MLNEKDIAKPNGKAHLSLAVLDNLNHVDVEQEMPTARDDARFERLMEAQAETMRTVNATLSTMSAALAKNGNGSKPFGEKLSQFLPSLIVLLGMGWTVARTDATRQVTIETQQSEIRILQEQYKAETAKTEQLVKLYLIKFGEDPMTVDTSKIKRK